MAENNVTDRQTHGQTGGQDRNIYASSPLGGGIISYYTVWSVMCSEITGTLGIFLKVKVI